ncbi:MAG: helix-turn-helix transcriptional regulator [Chloroflexi bacterium]|nr:helix-turn-helix transcriptional regulator [Chloroflexota bacterium]
MTNNRVAEYRRKMGYSQTEVARRARIASTNLSAVETGTRVAWPKLRRALSRILKAPQTELFPEEAANGGK